MSGRISKSRRSRKSEQRFALALAVTSSGFDMPIPCDSCDRSSRRCVASSNSDRCSECISRGLAHCDAIHFSPFQLRRLTSARSKIEIELEAAVEDLEEKQRLALEAAAKFRRLQKQRKLLSDRELRAVARGISDLEELESSERREEEDRRSSETAVAEHPLANVSALPGAAAAVVPPTAVPVGKSYSFLP